MSGRILIIGFLTFVVVFAAALWWFQTRAYYEETAAPTASKSPGRATRSATGAGSTRRPRRSSCGPVSASREAPDAPVAENAAPLVAPDWFDCFDAPALARALEAGEATAYLAAPG